MHTACNDAGVVWMGKRSVLRFSGHDDGECGGDGGAGVEWGWRGGLAGWGGGGGSVRWRGVGEDGDSHAKIIGWRQLM